MRPDTATNPSIFLRLRQTDPEPREIAWHDFSQRYSPVIASFARRLGARQQDVDDIVQDVLMGFFARSPTFVYDPTKGRFRGYLKVCTYRALHRRLGSGHQIQGRSIDQIDPEEMSIEQVWNDVWEQQRLRVALEEVRAAMGHTKTFQAFEMYVVFDQPADQVAGRLGMHLNSVYRAKDQVTRVLQEKLAVLGREE